MKFITLMICFFAFSIQSSFASKFKSPILNKALQEAIMEKRRVIGHACNSGIKISALKECTSLALSSMHPDYDEFESVMITTNIFDFISNTDSRNTFVSTLKIRNYGKELINLAIYKSISAAAFEANSFSELDSDSGTEPIDYFGVSLFDIQTKEFIIVF